MRQLHFKEREYAYGGVCGLVDAEGTEKRIESTSENKEEVRLETSKNGEKHGFY